MGLVAARGSVDLAGMAAGEYVCGCCALQDTVTDAIPCIPVSVARQRQVRTLTVQEVGRAGLRHPTNNKAATSSRDGPVNNSITVSREARLLAHKASKITLQSGPLTMPSSSSSSSKEARHLLIARAQVVSKRITPRSGKSESPAERVERRFYTMAWLTVHVQTQVLPPTSSHAAAATAAVN